MPQGDDLSWYGPHRSTGLNVGMLGATLLAATIAVSILYPRDEGARRLTPVIDPVVGDELAQGQHPGVAGADLRDDREARRIATRVGEGRQDRLAPAAEVVEIGWLAGADDGRQ